MDILRPMCDACIHLFNEEGWKCSAFPNGIPDKIWMSAKDHRHPAHGDHGIQFEQSPIAQPFDFALFESLTR